MRNWTATFTAVAAMALLLPALSLGAGTGKDPDAARRTRLARILAATPLIDGHNDLPWELRERTHGHLRSIDLGADTAHLAPPADSAALMTDLPRMKAGHVGAQFWSVWIPAETPGFQAVQMTLEQIDLVSASRPCIRVTWKWPTAPPMCAASTRTTASRR